MLLTEKNNVYVKGRAVFNVKQSRVWKTKEATCSTTTANDSFL